MGGISSATALLAGIALAIFIENPYSKITKAWTSRILQISVVGLGAGMNLENVLHAGAQGFLYTAIGITFTLALGLGLGFLLRNNPTVSLLISSGTAICGGSAIAAVATTIGAREEEISVALVTVFFLNAVALFLFPPIGHLLAMSQIQFGYWSALAIHDTSSVVGASLQFGPQALETATIIKLARALWIIPLALGIGFFWKRSGHGELKKVSHPWFILGFLAAAALVTWVPALSRLGLIINGSAKHLLVLTLFLIGSNCPKSIWTKPEARRSLVQGITLWLVVASATLSSILAGWIHP